MHCFICPTYGQYDYARAAVASFLRHTPDGIALVIDDAHPEFHEFWDKSWNVIAHHFPERGGLTRSWNLGLLLAREMEIEYTICGNSDILFTPGWDKGPVALLASEQVGVVGPLSNGPGLTNALQNIWDHVSDYKPSDSPNYLAGVAKRLHKRHPPDAHLVAEKVNGFFMIGRTARWWEGKFDDMHVFHPGRRFVLTESEDELQGRFRAKGWQSRVSLTSFIFHYRSVTRGDRFKHGLWHRRKAAKAS